MPTRARPAASSPTGEASSPQKEAPSTTMTPGLQFSEPLSWRAGKAIPVADLLKRLQKLGKEMKDMEQDENENARDGLERVAKELANPNLLGHKDKGVKAWTAACLVDILRLCAPDAPFTGGQLRDIFTMIITSILPALSDPSNAYNAQHLYVLQSLAQVKSIVLVTDLPNSEPLILHLFDSFFDILSGAAKNSTAEPISKNVEYLMTCILVTMIDESPSLPQEAVDKIVAQFLWTDRGVLAASQGKGKKNEAVDDKQSTLVLKELPPAYNMAKTVCNSCDDKMAVEISKYFNDVIIDASASSKNHSNRRNSGDFDDAEESILGPTEEDLKELYKAHRLLRELWRACPTVLQNVVPQLEAELSAENLQLRRLATETLGDMVSGIGAAGPPPPPVLDPAAYPPMDLSSSDTPTVIDLLTTPSSPQPFPQAHPHTWSSFLSRRQDKSGLIRATWTTAIGRIISTSAGGVGLNAAEEERLVEDLARMLNDADEKVRIAAIRAISNFSFRDVVAKLGSSGGVDAAGSVLANLAERIKDKKQAVRVDATHVLATLWGVAAGEIAEGNEQVISLLGGAPSKILNASYTNDMDVKVLLDHVFFELLLPLSYPPIKAKATKQVNGSSQVVKDSQTNGDSEPKAVDPDKIRTERILLLTKDLDEKAKKVFYSRCQLQAQLSKFLAAYLQSCEDYNGGVMDKNEGPIKERLTKLINQLAQLLPDPTTVSAVLWKFAKMHDRRSYQLIRYCMAPESDYRTVYKAFKEFTKRFENSQTQHSALLDTMIPLLYRTSILIYNKSHVPAIVGYSKTDEKGLGVTATEVLKDVSARTPEVLKAHVQEMCRSLQEDAPTPSRSNPLSAVDNLKACAAFARKFPAEIPQDRKFLQSMINFALHGSPPEAAKQATSVIIAAAADKEMIANDLAQKCIKGLSYGSTGFLPRLAALSQLWLVAPAQLDTVGDTSISVAKEILSQVLTPYEGDPSQNLWDSTIDEECAAKSWSLKILANKARSHSDASTLTKVTEPVVTLFIGIIQNEGELSTSSTTPPTHKSRLRLLAARLLLKLCLSKPHEALLTPQFFHKLAEVTQDPVFEVRSSFLARLKKYLSQIKLPARFYTPPFLLAFEPDTAFKAETVTWLKSRAAFFANLKSQTLANAPLKNETTTKASTVLESAFARLLSLLAHHPDYGPSADELLDSARYIIFYLSTVATEENISLIFHIAQRVKGCRDIIVHTSPEPSVDYSTHLHTLSDIATTAISTLIEINDWSLQTLPTFTRLTLPKSLFAEIKEHKEAIEIAECDFLPERVREGVQDLVRREVQRGKKRKHRTSEGGEAKKVKREPKEPKEKKEKEVAIRKKRKSNTKEDWDGSEDEKENGGQEKKERRRSGRVQVGGGQYKERDDSEDDAEMEALNAVSQPKAKTKASPEPEPEPEPKSESEADHAEAESEEPDGKKDGEKEDEDVDMSDEAEAGAEVTEDREAEPTPPPSPKAKTKTKAPPKSKVPPPKPRARGKLEVPKGKGKALGKVTPKGKGKAPTKVATTGRATRSRG